jgi:hypothetical protein
MKHEPGLNEAGREYAAAYATHYTEHNLPSALRLYKQVIALHPSDPVADYSQMQIQNIVNSVVPKTELLDAEIDLACTHFEQASSVT